MSIIGYFANRKVHTVEDYLVGGRKTLLYISSPYNRCHLVWRRILHGCLWYRVFEWC